MVNLSLNSATYESYQTTPINAAVEILWFNKLVVVVSAGNNGSGTLYLPVNDPWQTKAGRVIKAPKPALAILMFTLRFVAIPTKAPIWGSGQQVAAKRYTAGEGQQHQLEQCKLE